MDDESGRGSANNRNRSVGILDTGMRLTKKSC